MHDYTNTTTRAYKQLQQYLSKIPDTKMSTIDVLTIEFQIPGNKMVAKNTSEWGSRTEYQVHTCIV